ncbi:MAG: SDR family oxidoreductase [bacterium]|nr:SDR family oxidoreductase [bacterium]
MGLPYRSPDVPDEALPEVRLPSDPPRQPHLQEGVIDKPGLNGPPTALITGTNRGIGLGLATACARRGWRVMATCREPATASELEDLVERHPSVTVHRLDVNDDEQLDDLGGVIGDEPIDFVVHNAGWARPGGMLEVEYTSWALALRTNAFAVLRLAQAFVDNVARSRRRAIVAIGSEMGSISRTESGSRYAYRSSKAALNMIVRTLAFDLGERGVTVASVHPGWVRTRLGGPNAPMSPAECGELLAGVLDELTLEESGTFLDVHGRPIPW